MSQLRFNHLLNFRFAGRRCAFAEPSATGRCGQTFGESFRGRFFLLAGRNVAKIDGERQRFQLDSLRAAAAAFFFLFNHFLGHGRVLLLLMLLYLSWWGRLLWCHAGRVERVFTEIQQSRRRLLNYWRGLHGDWAFLYRHARSGFRNPMTWKGKRPYPLMLQVVVDQRIPYYPSVTISPSHPHTHFEFGTYGVTSAANPGQLPLTELLLPLSSHLFLFPIVFDYKCLSVCVGGKGTETQADSLQHSRPLPQSPS